MPPNRLDTVLRAALSFGASNLRSDAELLTRFVDHRDQTAFEVLIERHMPGVRAACRGWLRSPADIDDAAQATFLVLVQRAGSIREQAALGGWLYRVASNVARRLRRRAKVSQPLPEDVPGSERAEPDDLLELMTAEVARLPEKYRLPVQLCYFGGLTTAEAADRLGCPKGTVLTRLAWARQRLKKTLAGRGISAGLPGATALQAISRHWVDVTVRAGLSILAGTSPALVGISQQTVSLTEGVVPNMVWNKLKYIVLGALLALGGSGLGIHHWVTASDGSRVLGKAQKEKAESRDVAPLPVVADKEKEARPEQPEKQAKNPTEIRPGRRREAVIRLPVGTFVKDVEAAPYGSGRVTWTYEEDRVLGLIEVSVMGFEVELATEAEFSLSSNGTIYGLLTGVKLNHVRLPASEEFKEIQPFVGLWSLVEPLFAEMLLDLPFSYRFRVQGDRLVITNFRILLAGPNPLGKVGGILGDADEVFAVLAGFQALGTALEGTYVTDDGKEKPAPKKRKPFLEPGDKKMKSLPGLRR
jgi:RNA polymerase sigma factor (sigma-70 family)